MTQTQETGTEWADYVAVVAEGAALLDEVEPGWQHRIDLGQLSMPATCVCILGQLFGSYLEGLSSLAYRTTKDVVRHPESYGFTLLCNWDFASSPWRNLKAAWVSAIEERRK